MLSDLNTREIEIAAFYIMHHGMLRCKKDSEEYQVCRKIAEKFLDEVTVREKTNPLSVCLFNEYMTDSINRIGEVEYDPAKINKALDKLTIKQILNQPVK